MHVVRALKTKRRVIERKDIIRGFNFVRPNFTFELAILLTIRVDESRGIRCILETDQPSVSPGSFRFAEQLASQPGYETRLVERR